MIYTRIRQMRQHFVAVIWDRKITQRFPEMKELVIVYGHGIYCNSLTDMLETTCQRHHCAREIIGPFRP